MHKSESHVPLFRHCTRRKAASIPSQFALKSRMHKLWRKSWCVKFFIFLCAIASQCNSKRVIFVPSGQPPLLTPRSGRCNECNTTIYRIGKLVSRHYSHTKREHYSPANRPVQRTFLPLFQPLGPTCRNLTSVRHVIFSTCGLVTLKFDQMNCSDRCAPKKQIYSHWHTR